MSAEPEPLDSDFVLPAGVDEDGNPVIVDADGAIVASANMPMVDEDGDPIAMTAARFRRRRRRINLPNIPGDPDWDEHKHYRDPGTGEFAKRGKVTPSRLKGLLSDNARVRAEVSSEMRERVEDVHAGKLTEYRRAVRMGDRDKALQLARELRRDTIGPRPRKAGEDRNVWDAANREMAKIIPGARPRRATSTERDRSWLPTSRNPRVTAPRGSKLYHASPRRNRRGISTEGLRRELDESEGDFPDALYFSFDPPRDRGSEDVWEVDVSDLTIEVDDPAQMREFEDVGGSYLITSDIDRDRLNLVDGEGVIDPEHRPTVPQRPADVAPGVWQQVDDGMERRWNNDGSFDQRRTENGQSSWSRLDRDGNVTTGYGDTPGQNETRPRDDLTKALDLWDAAEGRDRTPDDVFGADSEPDPDVDQLSDELVESLRRIHDEVRDEAIADGSYAPLENCEDCSRRIEAAHPELKMVEGRYRKPGEPHPVSHFWNETDDGVIVDATADQFGLDWLQVVNPDDTDYGKYMPEGRDRTPDDVFGTEDDTRVDLDRPTVRDRPENWDTRPLGSDLTLEEWNPDVVGRDRQGEGDLPEPEVDEPVETATDDFLDLPAGTIRDSVFSGATRYLDRAEARAFRDDYREAEAAGEGREWLERQSPEFHRNLREKVDNQNRLTAEREQRDRLDRLDAAEEAASVEGVPNVSGPPPIPGETRDGYTFQGWHLTYDPDFSIDPDFDPDVRDPSEAGGRLFWTEDPKQWDFWTGDRPYAAEVWRKGTGGIRGADQRSAERDELDDIHIGEVVPSSVASQRGRAIYDWARGEDAERGFVGYSYRDENDELREITPDDVRRGIGEETSDEWQQAVEAARAERDGVDLPEPDVTPDRSGSESADRLSDTLARFDEWDGTRTPGSGPRREVFRVDDPDRPRDRRFGEVDLDAVDRSLYPKPRKPGRTPTGEWVDVGPLDGRPGYVRQRQARWNADGSIDVREEERSRDDSSLPFFTQEYHFDPDGERHQGISPGGRESQAAEDARRRAELDEQMRPTPPAQGRRKTGKWHTVDRGAYSELRVRWNEDGTIDVEKTLITPMYGGSDQRHGTYYHIDADGNKQDGISPNGYSGLQDDRPADDPERLLDELLDRTEGRTPGTPEADRPDTRVDLDRPTLPEATDRFDREVDPDTPFRLTDEDRQQILDDIDFGRFGTPLPGTPKPAHREYGVWYNDNETLGGSNTYYRWNRDGTFETRTETDLYGETSRVKYDADGTRITPARSPETERFDRILDEFDARTEGRDRRDTRSDRRIGRDASRPERTPEEDRAREGIRRAARREGIELPPDEEDRPDDADRFDIDRSGPAAMTQSEAVEAGFTEGPFFHATSEESYDSIMANGFTAPAAEDWELEDPGTMEEFRRSGTTQPVFIAPRRHQTYGYGERVIPVMVKPGARQPGTGFADGEEVIPEAVVPIKGKVFGRRALTPDTPGRPATRPTEWEADPGQTLFRTPPPDRPEGVENGEWIAFDVVGGGAWEPSRVAVRWNEDGTIDVRGINPRPSGEAFDPNVVERVDPDTAWPDRSDSPFHMLDQPRHHSWYDKDGQQHSGDREKWADAGHLDDRGAPDYDAARREELGRGPQKPDGVRYGEWVVDGPSGRIDGSFPTRRRWNADGTYEEERESVVAGKSYRIVDAEGREFTGSGPIEYMRDGHEAQIARRGRDGEIIPPRDRTPTPLEKYDARDAVVERLDLSRSEMGITPEASSTVAARADAPGLGVNRNKVGDPHTNLDLPDPTATPDLRDPDSNWTRLGGRSGSNPGGLYRLDNTAAADAPGSVNVGDKFYVKQPRSVDHARVETATNLLYEAAGVPVPDVHMNADNDRIASRIIPGDLTDLPTGMSDPEIASNVRRGMVVDAWLANWDVVGAVNDNIVIGPDGTPWRIDSGGGLIYRARGDRKGRAFGDTVGEIDTFRDPSLNPTAANVFGNITRDELRAGAEQVAAISPDRIRAIVASVDADASIADTLIARRQDIIDRLLDGNDPLDRVDTTPEVDTTPGEQIEVTPDGLQVGDIFTGEDLYAATAMPFWADKDSSIEYEVTGIDRSDASPAGWTVSLEGVDSGIPAEAWFSDRIDADRALKVRRSDATPEPDVTPDVDTTPETPGDTDTPDTDEVTPDVDVPEVERPLSRLEEGDRFTVGDAREVFVGSSLSDYGNDTVLEVIGPPSSEPLGTDSPDGTYWSVLVRDPDGIQFRVSQPDDSEFEEPPGVPLLPVPEPDVTPDDTIAVADLSEGDVVTVGDLRDLPGVNATFPDRWNTDDSVRIVTAGLVDADGRIRFGVRDADGVGGYLYVDATTAEDARISRVTPDADTTPDVDVPDLPPPPTAPPTTFNTADINELEVGDQFRLGDLRERRGMWRGALVIGSPEVDDDARLTVVEAPSLEDDYWLVDVVDPNGRRWTLEQPRDHGWEDGPEITRPVLDATPDADTPEPDVTPEPEVTFRDTDDWQVGDELTATDLFGTWFWMDSGRADFDEAFEERLGRDLVPGEMFTISEIGSAGPDGDIPIEVRSSDGHAFRTHVKSGLARPTRRPVRDEATVPEAPGRTTTARNLAVGDVLTGQAISDAYYPDRGWTPLVDDVRVTTDAIRDERFTITDIEREHTDAGGSGDYYFTVETADGRRSRFTVYDATEADRDIETVSSTDRRSPTPEELAAEPPPTTPPTDLPAPDAAPLPDEPRYADVTLQADQLEIGDIIRRGDLLGAWYRRESDRPETLESHLNSQFGSDTDDDTELRITRLLDPVDSGYRQDGDIQVEFEVVGTDKRGTVHLRPSFDAVPARRDPDAARRAAEEREAARERLRARREELGLMLFERADELTTPQERYEGLRTAIQAEFDNRELGPDEQLPIPVAREQRAVARQLAEDWFNIEAEDGSWRSQVDNVSSPGRVSAGAGGTIAEDSGTFIVSGTIRDARGRQIGSWTRNIYPTKNKVYHAVFSMNESTRGSGIGRQFIHGSMERMRDAGVERVTVGAYSTPDGSWNGVTVWPRLGFEIADTWSPSGSSASRLASRLADEGWPEVTADAIRAHPEALNGLGLTIPMVMELSTLDRWMRRPGRPESRDVPEADTTPAVPEGVATVAARDLAVGDVLTREGIESIVDGRARSRWGRRDRDMDWTISSVNTTDRGRVEVEVTGRTGRRLSFTVPRAAARRDVEVRRPRRDSDTPDAGTTPDTPDAGTTPDTPDAVTEVTGRDLRPGDRVSRADLRGWRDFQIDAPPGRTGDFYTVEEVADPDGDGDVRITWAAPDGEVFYSYAYPEDLGRRLPSVDRGDATPDTTPSEATPRTGPRQLNELEVGDQFRMDGIEGVYVRDTDRSRFADDAVLTVVQAPEQRGDDTWIVYAEDANGERLTLALDDPYLSDSKFTLLGDTPDTVETPAATGPTRRAVDIQPGDRLTTGEIARLYAPDGSRDGLRSRWWSPDDTHRYGDPDREWTVTGTERVRGEGLRVAVRDADGEEAAFYVRPSGEDTELSLLPSPEAGVTRTTVSAGDLRVGDRVRVGDMRSVLGVPGDRSWGDDDRVTITRIGDPDADGDVLVSYEANEGGPFSGFLFRDLGYFDRKVPVERGGTPDTDTSSSGPVPSVADWSVGDTFTIREAYEQYQDFDSEDLDEFHRYFFRGRDLDDRVTITEINGPDDEDDYTVRFEAEDGTTDWHYFSPRVSTLDRGTGSEDRGTPDSARQVAVENVTTGDSFRAGDLAAVEGISGDFDAIGDLDPDTAMRVVDVGSDADQFELILEFDGDEMTLFVPNGTELPVQGARSPSSARERVEAEGIEGWYESADELDGVADLFAAMRAARAVEEANRGRDVSDLLPLPGANESERQQVVRRAAEAMFNIEAPDGSWRSEISSANLTTSTLGVSGSIVDADGRRLGGFSRSVPLDTDEPVYHSSFRLNEGTRGMGIGRGFIFGSMEQMREAGYSRVEVGAHSTSDGEWTGAGSWPRFGFEINYDDWSPDSELYDRFADIGIDEIDADAIRMHPELTEGLTLTIPMVFDLDDLDYWRSPAARSRIAPWEPGSFDRFAGRDTRTSSRSAVVDLRAGDRVSGDELSRILQDFDVEVPEAPDGAVYEITSIDEPDGDGDVRIWFTPTHYGDEFSVFAYADTDEPIESVSLLDPDAETPRAARTDVSSTLRDLRPGDRIDGDVLENAMADFGAEAPDGTEGYFEVVDVPDRDSDGDINFRFRDEAGNEFTVYGYARELFTEVDLDEAGPEPDVTPEPSSGPRETLRRDAFEDLRAGDRLDAATWGGSFGLDSSSGREALPTGDLTLIGDPYQNDAGKWRVAARDEGSGREYLLSRPDSWSGTSVTRAAPEDPETSGRSIRDLQEGDRFDYDAAEAAGFTFSGTLGRRGEVEVVGPPELGASGGRDRIPVRITNDEGVVEGYLHQTRDTPDGALIPSRRTPDATETSEEVAGRRTMDAFEIGDRMRVGSAADEFYSRRTGGMRAGSGGGDGVLTVIARPTRDSSGEWSVLVENESGDRFQIFSTPDESGTLGSVPLIEDTPDVASDVRRPADLRAGDRFLVGDVRSLSGIRTPFTALNDTDEIEVVGFRRQGDGRWQVAFRPVGGGDQVRGVFAADAEMRSSVGSAVDVPERDPHLGSAMRSRDEITAAINDTGSAQSFYSVVSPATFSGTKLHIEASTPEQTDDAYQRVYDIVQARGLGMKVATPKFHTYAAGTGQEGKGVTIYLPRRDTVDDDIGFISRALEGYDAPGRGIAGDEPVDGVPGLYRRYELSPDAPDRDLDYSEYHRYYVPASATPSTPDDGLVPDPDRPTDLYPERSVPVPEPTPDADITPEDLRRRTQAATAAGRKIRARVGDDRLSRAGLRKGDHVEIEYLNSDTAKITWSDGDGHVKEHRARWERFDGIEASELDVDWGDGDTTPDTSAAPITVSTDDLQVGDRLSGAGIDRIYDGSWSVPNRDDASPLPDASLLKRKDWAVTGFEEMPTGRRRVLVETDDGDRSFFVAIDGPVDVEVRRGDSTPETPDSRTVTTAANLEVGDRLTGAMLSEIGSGFTLREDVDDYSWAADRDWVITAVNEGEGVHRGGLTYGIRPADGGDLRMFSVSRDGMDAEARVYRDTPDTPDTPATSRRVTGLEEGDRIDGRRLTRDILPPKWTFMPTEGVDEWEIRSIESRVDGTVRLELEASDAPIGETEILYVRGDADLPIVSDTPEPDTPSAVPLSERGTTDLVRGDVITVGAIHDVVARPTAGLREEWVDDPDKRLRIADVDGPDEDGDYRITLADEDGREDWFYARDGRFFMVESPGGDLTTPDTASTPVAETVAARDIEVGDRIRGEDISITFYGSSTGWVPTERDGVTSLDSDYVRDTEFTVADIETTSTGGRTLLVTDDTGRRFPVTIWASEMDKELPRTRGEDGPGIPDETPDTTPDADGIRTVSAGSLEQGDVLTGEEISRIAADRSASIGGVVDWGTRDWEVTAVVEATGEDSGGRVYGVRPVGGGDLRSFLVPPGELDNEASVRRGVPDTPATPSTKRAGDLETGDVLTRADIESIAGGRGAGRWATDDYDGDWEIVEVVENPSGSRTVKVQGLGDRAGRSSFLINRSSLDADVSVGGAATTDTPSGSGTRRLGDLREGDVLDAADIAALDRLSVRGSASWGRSDFAGEWKVASVHTTDAGSKVYGFRREDGAVGSIRVRPADFDHEIPTVGSGDTPTVTSRLASELEPGDRLTAGEIGAKIYAPYERYSWWYDPGPREPTHAPDTEWTVVSTRPDPDTDGIRVTVSPVDGGDESYFIIRDGTDTDLDLAAPSTPPVSTRAADVSVGDEVRWGEVKDSISGIPEGSLADHRILTVLGRSEPDADGMMAVRFRSGDDMFTGFVPGDSELPVKTAGSTRYGDLSEEAVGVPRRVGAIEPGDRFTAADLQSADIRLPGAAPDDVVTATFVRDLDDGRVIGFETLDGREMAVRVGSDASGRRLVTAAPAGSTTSIPARDLQPGDRISLEDSRTAGWVSFGGDGDIEVLEVTDEPTSTLPDGRLVRFRVGDREDAIRVSEDSPTLRVTRTDETQWVDDAIASDAYQPVLSGAGSRAEIEDLIGTYRETRSDEDRDRALQALTTAMAEFVIAGGRAEGDDKQKFDQAREWAQGRIEALRNAPSRERLAGRARQLQDRVDDPEPLEGSEARATLQNMAGEASELSSQYLLLGDMDEAARWEDTAVDLQAKADELVPPIRPMPYDVERQPVEPSRYRVAEAPAIRRRIAGPDGEGMERRAERLAMRVPSKAIVGILTDGRAYSQHVTGTSRGMYGPSTRRSAERTMFGDAVGDAPNEDMPVYGFFDEGQSFSSARQYGEFLFRMRPEMSSRTTITFDDSLSATERPLFIDELPDASNEELVAAGRERGWYYEIQIHGGWTLDEVRPVVEFHGDTRPPAPGPGSEYAAGLDKVWEAARLARDRGLTFWIRPNGRDAPGVEWQDLARQMAAEGIDVRLGGGSDVGGLDMPDPIGGVAAGGGSAGTAGGAAGV